MPGIFQQGNFVMMDVGNQLYAYDLTQPPLGGGAMGTVYRGFNTRTGQPVAIKMVKPEFANNLSIRDRARKEAAMAFRHTNLVEMLGYAEFSPNSGPLYILSNMVQGENIDDYIRKRLDDDPDRVEKIARMACRVLDALSYIHSYGIIHRDIKPSNIMVELDSNVRLMDLGIARQDFGGQHSVHEFIGTPQYAAPEQIGSNNPNGDKVDATTDIYEMGITLYELLDGSNPFDSPTQAKTLIKQMQEALPPSPKIPKPLMKVLWKATAKEQQDRYQTAAEFKKAIEDALNYQPSPIEQATEWVKENPVIAGLAAGVVVALIALLILLAFI